MLVDRGVEGVSRGCDAKAIWKQLKKDSFEGRDEERASLCKTLCVWNPFLAYNPVKFPGIFIRL